MTDRIYVIPKVSDNREKVYQKTFSGLSLSGKVSKVEILDCYLISHSLPKEKFSLIPKALVNPILEKYSINDLNILIGKNDFAIEISFLPGVTDNVGHTAKETILDLLHDNTDQDFNIFYSKIFLISGKIKDVDVRKIASSLHNSLIEKALILNKKQIKQQINLPLNTPEVVLEKRALAQNISLDVSDEELIRIGKEGILDPLKNRRGPLALDLSSMLAIKKYFNGLDRNPTDIELESLAQTWSEHCKHTIFANPIDDISNGLYKTYIKGATNEIRKRKGRNDFCVSVFSDNSGGVIFDDKYLITHKVETHNSPSALDPYGGAITGIVGVNRDTIGFGLGAKPVANVYGFCVGQPTDTKTLYRDKEKKQKMFTPKRILDGVIKGVNAGGNTSGIPTLNGFVKFDDRYRGKPLVFAGTIGIIPRKINDRLSHEKNALAGDYIVVIGGRVGADGIHGATFSSVAMDSGSPATAVQIGDPITQKKLSDAIVKEARAMNLYNSITDNGAGGISCSVAEMARECGGAIVDLEKVPIKYSGLEPWQIWISESQERMTLSVPKKKWPVFSKLMESRGVEATVIGVFTDTKKCIVNYEGRKIMDIDMEFLHNGQPKHQLKTEKVIIQNTEPKLEIKKNYTSDLLNLLENKNISGFSFISEQYDHEVQASSVVKPITGRGRINTDTQIFRPVLNSPKGVALSSALYPSYGDISSYDMASCAIDTTIRNIIASGGTLKNLSILDNFCWCSSNDPKRLDSLVDAVKACYDTAVGYLTPFISGKDSMFNDFKGYDEDGKPVLISIPPTLLISGISVMPDLLKAITPEFKKEGDLIYLLGNTNNELGGGEYLKMFGFIGNLVPKVDIKQNLKTYHQLEELIDRGILSSSMSVNSGGLAVALAKACIGGMLGSEVKLDEICGNTNNIIEKLFSESQGRVLISLDPSKKNSFEKMLRNIPHTKIGTVTKNNNLIVTDNNKKFIDVTVKKISESYHKFSNQNK
jgi:phosphoribosylformylglycinamidine synthase II